MKATDQNAKTVWTTEQFTLLVTKATVKPERFTIIRCDDGAIANFNGADAVRVREEHAACLTNAEVNTLCQSYGARFDPPAATTRVIEPK